MARLLVIMGMWIIFIFAGLGYAEDQLTITTYYPSPYGNYRELSAQRMKIGTTYSGSGTTVTDNNLIVEGSVGIGTASPQAKLDVDGGIKIGSDNICNINKEGTTRYNSTSKMIEVCDGTNWTSTVSSGTWCGLSMVCSGSLCGLWFNGLQPASADVLCQGYNPLDKCPPGYTQFSHCSIAWNTGQGPGGGSDSICDTFVTCIKD
ncbi:MAG: hypothetical protein V1490_03035 [Candidatus Omnitrophota bacterium]